MSGKCSRKHTPIVSKAQKGLFYHWEGTPRDRPDTISAKEVKSHLAEVAGEHLPARKKGGKGKR